MQQRQQHKENCNMTLTPRVLGVRLNFFVREVGTGVLNVSSSAPTSCLSTLRCFSKIPIILVILLMAALVKATMNDVPRTSQVAWTLAYKHRKPNGTGIEREVMHQERNKSVVGNLAACVNSDNNKQRVKAGGL